MERAHSVPSSRPTSNPFYSEKVQLEMQLEANRPSDLPRRSSGAIGMEITSSSPGVGGSLQGAIGPTGKGRGGQSAGLLDALQPTEFGREPLKTQGALPIEEQPRTMGPVGAPLNESKGREDGDLQRALEGELVEFLRNQNSKCLEEVAALRDKLEKSSGMGSSPWSAVDGVESVETSQPHTAGSTW